MLVLEYLRRARRMTPEIEMKAVEYINLGYQRLLNFEVDGGGFDWYGNPPANLVLSAYGLVEFTDMAKVYEIDGPFFFGAAEQFEEVIASTGTKAKVVIFRMRRVPYMDATALNAFSTAVKRLRKRGLEVILSALHERLVLGSP